MTRKLLMTLIIGLSMFIFSTPANANLTTEQVKSKIVQHAKEVGVDPALALSLAQLESNFNPKLRSTYGAIGLFQLMPDTARRLGVNPWYVNDNIKGGLMYYKMMYKKFGSMDLALAAYNAGEGNVSRYKGIPPFKETRAFIQKVKNGRDSIKTDPDYQNIL